MFFSSLQLTGFLYINFSGKMNKEHRVFLYSSTCPSIHDWEMRTLGRILIFLNIITIIFYTVYFKNSKSKNLLYSITTSSLSSKDASIYFLLIFAFTNILHLSSTFLYLSANHLVCFKEVDQEIPLWASSIFSQYLFPGEIAMLSKVSVKGFVL